MTDEVEAARRRSAWIEAAKILAVDPNAKVICPAQGDAHLEVRDAPFPGGAERWLQCPACHAREALLLRK
jgi:hypothetical protein